MITETLKDLTALGFAPNSIKESLASMQLSVVADGSLNNFNGSGKTVATAGTYDSVRTAHYNRSGKTIIGLVLVYANYAQAGSTEVANPNSINVQAAYEPLSPTSIGTQDQPRSQAQFNGATTALIDRRAVIKSDIIPVIIPPNTNFFIRTGSTSTNNGGTVSRGICARGGTSGFGINNGEGADGSANKIGDGGGTITVNTSTAIYSPSAILGILADGSICASVALLGDSITAGTDDAGYGYNYGGWPIRAFANYPHVYLPIAGETMAQFADRVKSHNRFQIASFCSTIHCAYGRNDIQQSRTLAQFKADVLTVAGWFMGQGKRFIQATILPAPTSTDGFFTVASQTKDTLEATRVSFNAWIRDATVTGFVAQANAQMVALGITRAGDAKISDPCAGIECDISGVLTQDGGYILGSQSALLTNGTATSGSTTTLNDTGKSWTVNDYKGYTCFIVSGTGAGQVRTIGYNTATQLVFLNAGTALDNTSVYQVFNGLGMNGVHPCSTGHALAAASITASDLII